MFEWKSSCLVVGFTEKYKNNFGTSHLLQETNYEALLPCSSSKNDAIVTIKIN